MCELAPTEVAISDAFRRNQLACRQALTHDRASRVGLVTGEWRTLRVLVVDDEQSAADRLVGLVGRWGHAPCLAYDGASGLKVAATQHPDVVLLDLDMPFMDGYEVARQLRLDFPRTKCFIIGITAWADEQCRQQCGAADIDLVLVKPVDPPVLETLLMLECQRLHRARTDSRHKGDGTVKAPRSRLAVKTANGGPPC
jgi:CheY-like chemotaxis protein